MGNPNVLNISICSAYIFTAVGNGRLLFLEILFIMALKGFFTLSLLLLAVSVFSEGLQANQGEAYLRRLTLQPLGSDEFP